MCRLLKQSDKMSSVDVIGQQNHQQQIKLKSAIDYNSDGGCADGADTDTELNSPNYHKKSERRSSCVKLLLRITFSTPGLVVLVAMYSIMGAFIFPVLEGPPASVSKSMLSISKSREECLKELWIITERLNVLYERNWTLLVHEQLKRFEGSIVAATKGGVLVEAMGDHMPRWSFSEALLYSVTVITTIGHGNLTPKTSEGKIVTIIYAIIGVPLMLMCLSSLGGLLAEALQCAYTKLCLASSSSSSAPSSLTTSTITTTTELSSHNGRLCKKRDQHQRKLKYEGAQQSDGIDCADCKYDPISVNRKYQTYDKYSSIKDHEDSCQLIKNSPTKSMLSAASSPHSSPIAQLKNQQHYVIKSIMKNSGNALTSSPYHNYNCNSSTTSSPAHTIPPATGLSYSNTLQHQHHHAPLYYATPPPPLPTAVATMPATGSHHSSPTNGNFETIEECNPQQVQRLNNYQTLPHHHHHHHYHHCQHPHNKTATVHGIGRSKYIPKPLPQEINVLLSECDITQNTTSNKMNCNQNFVYSNLTTSTALVPAPLLSSSSPTSTTITTAAASAGTTVAGAASPNNTQQFYVSNKYGIDSDSGGCCGGDGGGGGSIVGIKSENITDDDDDEDNNRIGCPHGTPSKIPLIPLSNHKTQNYKQKMQSRPQEMTTNFIENDNTMMMLSDGRAHHQHHGYGDQMLQRAGSHVDDDQDQDVDDDDDDNDDLNSPQVPFIIIFLILISYISLGTIIFTIWENWSIIDGAYFCFVTLSTIGFGGELIPRKTFNGPELQLFACCAYLLLGLVLVAMSLNLIESQLMWKIRRLAVRLKFTRD